MSEQFICGLVPRSEVKLSDEQVDLLNNDPEVKKARHQYFEAKKLGIQEAADQSHLHYLRIFEARLEWVVQNPPPPKPKPKPLVGFAKRA